jgi:hypothetical protein
MRKKKEVYSMLVVVTTKTYLPVATTIKKISMAMMKYFVVQAM